jgi:DNA-binding response OmpR family regulator
MDNVKRVLIVEDETAFLKAFASELAFRGFKVSTATDGKKGLETALAEHPDLIFLDIILPVMDGIAILKELRKDAWGKTVNVILLTQVGDTDRIAEAMENGVFKYFIKADQPMSDIIEQTGKYLASLKFGGAKTG